MGSMVYRSFQVGCRRPDFHLRLALPVEQSAVVFAGFVMSARPADQVVNWQKP